MYTVEYNGKTYKMIHVQTVRRFVDSIINKPNHLHATVYEGNKKLFDILPG